MSDDEMAKEFAVLKEKGFTASKVFIPVNNKEAMVPMNCSRARKIAADKVKKVREAVGDNFDLIVEVHRCMSTPEAVAFAQEIEKYHPMVLEDPIVPDNVDAMALWRKRRTFRVQQENVLHILMSLRSSCRDRRPGM